MQTANWRDIFPSALLRAPLRPLLSLSFRASLLLRLLLSLLQRLLQQQLFLNSALRLLTLSQLLAKPAHSIACTIGRSVPIAEGS